MSGQDFQKDPMTFASLVAHQMQSPLAAVSQAMQTLLADYAGPLSPRQRDTLEQASQRCEQAVTSVRRMLAILKATQAPQAPAGPSSVMAVVRQVQGQYLDEAARHDISLGTESDGEPLFVPLGEAALSEALSAMVSNALKYTPDHGVIRVTASGSAPDGAVRLSVSDSGVGVPEALRQKVFEPFFRTPAARDSARPGVGLGLAFVKSVVEAAGGRVAVTPSPIGGAEFVVDLPRAAAPADEPPAKEPSLRVVIVGGVAAGPKAAAKIIRLQPGTDVTVVERGSVMSYAGCGLPYYVSGVVRDQKRLISSPAGLTRDPVFFHNVKNVHVKNQAEALAIDRPNRRVRVRDRLTGRESWLPYDRLLLATGASPVVPTRLATPLKNVFTLHGVRDAEGIKATLADGKARDVVIVGGGLIGIEMTEALVSRGARVTILERLPHILPMLDHDIACLVEKHMEAHGVRIVTGGEARAFEGRESVEAVVTDQGRFAADMVILAVGIRPNTELAAAAGLEIGSTGALRVDSRMRTSDPDIYAAGDCVETTHLVTGRPCYVPLGSTANKQARVAAMNICGRPDAFPGVVGSVICKVFDYHVARTGLGESEAREAGFDALTVLVPGPDREHFMPNMGLLLLKLIVDRGSRRLLGAQATGTGVADKRIDVAAMAIAARKTVDELANADLCYAPPYSTAIDNLSTAANVARNKLDGAMAGIAPAEVWARMQRKEAFVFLDVRTPGEYEAARLPQSVLIPLGALRGRLADLPRDREIVVFCDISLRAYEASLILRAAGFDRVRVMDGGIAMWPYDKVM